MQKDAKRCKKHVETQAAIKRHQAPSSAIKRHQAPLFAK